MGSFVGVWFFRKYVFGNFVCLKFGSLLACLVRFGNLGEGVGHFLVISFVIICLFFPIFQ